MSFSDNISENMVAEAANEISVSESGLTDIVGGLNTSAGTCEGEQMLSSTDKERSKGMGYL